LNQSFISKSLVTTRVVIPGWVFQFLGIQEWMDVLIPGNPGRPGMTLNVPYCSDMTITIVELLASNYLN